MWVGVPEEEGLPRVVAGALRREPTGVALLCAGCVTWRVTDRLSLGLICWAVTEAALLDLLKECLWNQSSGL